MGTEQSIGTLLKNLLLVSVEHEPEFDHVPFVELRSNL